MLYQMFAMLAQLNPILFLFLHSFSLFWLIELKNFFISTNQSHCYNNKWKCTICNISIWIISIRDLTYKGLRRSNAAKNVLLHATNNLVFSEICVKVSNQAYEQFSEKLVKLKRIKRTKQCSVKTLIINSRRSQKVADSSAFGWALNWSHAIIIAVTSVPLTSFTQRALSFSSR